MSLLKQCAAIVAVGVLAMATPAMALDFTVEFMDADSWPGGGGIYAQGFTPGLGPNPDPDPDPATVYLMEFEFFKSGNQDNATDIQLAIVNTMYPDLTSGSIPAANVVGVSSNVLANTDSLVTYDSIAFQFDCLELDYFGEYSAIYVNESGGDLTPVLVESLTANYAEMPPGSGDFHPTSNYGWPPDPESDFDHVTSNFINNGFFSAFSYAGDARFRATFCTSCIPEPSSVALGFIGMAALAFARRRCI